MNTKSSETGSIGHTRYMMNANKIKQLTAQKRLATQTPKKSKIELGISLLSARIRKMHNSH